MIKKGGIKIVSNKSKQKLRKQSQGRTQTSNPNKKKFERRENETIDQCLDRIRNSGYTPVKRIEKPIFKEMIENGEKSIIPNGQQTIFEGILNKSER